MMPTVGFHASHEQLAPGDLLQAVIDRWRTNVFGSEVAQIAELGVDGLYLHHLGRDQERFIEVFGERVLPEVAR